MLRRWTKTVAVLLTAAVALGVSACSTQSSTGSGTGSGTGSTDDGKIKVSVTFNGMKEFTEAVGKDKVEVSTIIPDGTEPHDFEPKAQDLAALSSADIFVYNGLGMETWAEDAVSAAKNDKLIVVEASKGAEPITNIDAGEIEEHGQYDPHLWLSLKGAEIEAENIKNALVEADAKNADYYEKNYDEFVAQLEGIYNEYSPKFQSSEKKSFVTGHAAFGYLCRDFGLEQNSVEDVFAEGEPTAQQLTELIQYCKDNSVTTIFAEEMASPEVSQTLADEVGAEVKTIYTIESAEDDMSYIDRVKDNLSKIYASLS